MSRFSELWTTTERSWMLSPDIMHSALKVSAASDMDGVLIPTLCWKMYGLIVIPILCRQVERGFRSQERSSSM